MIITPLIRDNIALNSYPLGCKQNILNQIDEVKNLPPISDKKLNVLIIGGSSGYGLASRIALTFNSAAYTYNVSIERAPKGRSTGSAGYYNNTYFNEIAALRGFKSDDYNGDAFSHETKRHVIADLHNMQKKIDLVIYSVASGIRFDPDTGTKYVSSLKPINTPFSGYNVDIATEKLRMDTLAIATQQEIDETIKVMGGEDYVLWAKALVDADVLAEGAQFVTYTYLGSETTHPIYKDGTIGHAKRDLERANAEINTLLKPIHGSAIISASKAVVTKASVFIPTMALYASALFKVMKELGTHESIVMHKYRLFKDMLYGNNAVLDDTGIYRLDAFEMDTHVQTKVEEILRHVTPDNFSDLVSFNDFKHEFLAINGFDIEGVDYSVSDNSN